MNILITSVGQRGYLIEHFKKSSDGNIGIFGADATKYAPALQDADKAFIVPYANSPNFYKKLLEICKNNNIKGILSINDLELPILAKYKEDFMKEGIMPIISSPDIVEKCFDKYETYKFCKQNNIGVPRTYLWTEKSKLVEDIKKGIIGFPIVAKPRKGSRSVGIHFLDSMQQLLEDIKKMEKSSLREDEKLIFQEYIDSKQYSIHVFNDMDLEPVNVVTMVNLFQHLGETFHIKTFRDSKLTQLGEKIGNKLKHFGPLSADVHRRENGEYVVLEFNPRISGCYSLTHCAGVDFAKKIFSCIKGESIKNKKIDDFDDCIMLKQFTTKCFTEKQISEKIEE